MLHVVWVHRLDLLARWRAEDLDDLNELVDPGLARKERLTKHELGHDTAGGPDVDGRRIVGRAENELGGPVIARADVRHVRLPGNEDLGRAKVDELEYACRWVDEEVLGLDVAVADADRVDVVERAEELVHVELSNQGRRESRPGERASRETARSTRHHPRTLIWIIGIVCFSLA